MRVSLISTTIMAFGTLTALDPRASIRHSYMSNYDDDNLQTFEPSPISVGSASFENFQATNSRDRHHSSHENLAHQPPIRECSSPQIQQGIQGENAGSPKLWTPLFLRRPVLISFSIVFAALIISIAVLFYLSTRNGHLSSADPKLYYLWVYGPTAGTFAHPFSNWPVHSPL